MPSSSSGNTQAERPIATTSRQSNGASAVEGSSSRKAPTNGQNGSMSQANKRPHPSNGPFPETVNGTRPSASGSRSTSPLPPPLASRPAATGSNTAASAPSTSRLPRSDVPPPTKKVKPEPHSSPSRMRVDQQAQAKTSTEQSDAIITPEDEAHLDFLSADQDQAGPSRGFSPPPLQDVESQPSSAGKFFNAPSVPAIPPVEDRRPTPSTSASVPPQPAKAEAPSPRFPSLGQRTAGVKLDSPMPSMSQSQSQSCK